MKTATRTATADLGNPHPSNEKFQNWLEAFTPELSGLQFNSIRILYTAAWCNGVTEERAFNEKNSQVSNYSANKGDA